MTCGCGARVTYVGGGLYHVTYIISLLHELSIDFFHVFCRRSSFRSIVTKVSRQNRLAPLQFARWANDERGPACSPGSHPFSGWGDSAGSAEGDLADSHRASRQRTTSVTCGCVALKEQQIIRALLVWLIDSPTGPKLLCCISDSRSVFQSGSSFAF